MQLQDVTIACRGKKTAWASWNVYPDTTKAFREMSTCTTALNEQGLNLIEIFAILRYVHISELIDISAVRQERFTIKVDSCLPQGQR